MKAIKLILALSALGVVGISSAWADGHGGYGGHWGHGGYYGGRSHIGISIGVPFDPWYYPPAYYYPPYAYYPPVVVQPQEPPVYIERAQESASSSVEGSDNYWYYCAKSKTYYPYVKQCPGGWQKVLPQPPDQR